MSLALQWSWQETIRLTPDEPDIASMDNRTYAAYRRELKHIRRGKARSARLAERNRKRAKCRILTEEDKRLLALIERKIAAFEAQFLTALCDG